MPFSWTEIWKENYILFNVVVGRLWGSNTHKNI